MRTAFLMVGVLFFDFQSSSKMEDFERAKTEFL